MCYNVSVSVQSRVLEKRFKASFSKHSLFQPIYHASAFALPFIPVITDDHEDTIQMFQWGLIPAWVKDISTAGKLRMQTLNAKAETLHEKPSFRHSIKCKRCMVLVNGFYEWQEVNKVKYPYYIYFGKHDPFALAGIWDAWTNPETGEISNTFSVITTKANTLLSAIHNTKKRMPVILKPEHEKEWLYRNLTENKVTAMLETYDDKRLSAHPISRLITSRGRERNTPEVMKEYRYKELEKIDAV